jgi:hypothetical protein
MADGGSSNADRVNEDSVEGEEVGMVDGVSEDSVEGEDVSGGGRRELAWEGFWGEFILSIAWSSAAKSVLMENWVNAESKLDDDEADERRFLPRAA